MMRRILFFVFFIGMLDPGFGQYQWKLDKDKDGIKVYLSDVAGTNYKAVRVQCTFPGTYLKLFSLLSNVSRNVEWVYNSKTSYLLKQNNPLDFWYYSETHFPWPLSNRDVVIHIRMQTDSMPKFFTSIGTGEPDFIATKSGKVRIPHYYAYWKVTMPTAETIHIDYILEADPGGTVPSWLSNVFVDKGPYETFRKLGELLQK
ncbi:MAG TPA: START domain-containing protein [Chitinophagaceae bacterium]|nr:START domain-containing protein [Chitinophagaceae bacterium]